MLHDYILHYGTKRHSGRYPWGSGEHPYQDEAWFKGWGELTKTMSTREIAEQFGMSMKELRYRYSYAKDAAKAGQICHIKELRNTRQMSVKAIAEKMGISESAVIAALKPQAEERVRQTRDLADALIQHMNKNKNVRAIDVGKGVSNLLGVTPTKLEAALTVLKDEGYIIVKHKLINQADTKHKTEMMYLYSPPDDWSGLSEEEKTKRAYKDVMQNLDKIEPPFDIHVNEDGKTEIGIEPPAPVSSKRVQVSFDEKDGLIELRQGCQDLSMGNDRYAQVRISIDGTHYAKGVAVYSDNLPKGCDILVHAAKSKRNYPMMDSDPDAKQVLKPMKRDAEGNIDTDDPFGAQIKKGGQIYYTDKDGNKVLGAINKVNEEGSWGNWTSARTLASQILSKQDPSIAAKQLELQRTKYAEQYEEILKISNPVVREKELIDFSEECEKAAVHMKAASLPGQSVCVILPGVTLKENECYAPGYKDGTKLALVRYPHTGKHELPILTVNNRNKECRDMIGTNVGDAICIHPSAAEVLSGADFDGDTVVVIPNNKGLIKSAPQLKSLEGFDTKEAYPGYPGMKVIKHDTQQKEMGVVTNLITDMNLIGATEDEMARAVKYSMVIIDAEKHKLNYKACKEEMRISELQKKYQDKGNGKYGGAGTIVSRASGEIYIPEREWQGKIDPKTGEKIWRYTDRRKTVDPVTGKWKYYNPQNPKYDPNGEPAQIKTTQMAYTTDARTLMSPAKYKTEQVYANYANQMKEMARQARLKTLSIEEIKYNPEAAEEYATEIESLKQKIETAKINAVLERRAQRITSVIVNEKMMKYPERYNNKSSEGKSKLSKLRSQVLKRQRALLDKSRAFTLNPREWEAIQSGAIRKTLAREIINRADQDSVKRYAYPKNDTLTALTSSNIARAKAMLNSGFTQAEVAESFGISATTLRKYL